MIRTALTALASAAFLIACGGGDETPAQNPIALCEPADYPDSANGTFDPEWNVTRFCPDPQVYIVVHHGQGDAWSVIATNAQHVASHRAYVRDGQAYLVGSNELIGAPDEFSTYAICSRDRLETWTAGECE